MYDSSLGPLGWVELNEDKGIGQVKSHVICKNVIAKDSI